MRKIARNCNNNLDLSYLAAKLETEVSPLHHSYVVPHTHVIFENGCHFHDHKSNFQCYCVNREISHLTAIYFCALG